ncbi:MAG: hypothetical protein AUH86_15975 [Acidobacteria bacterium 13_1_40CM_4_58_4]|nr:MAG: hypothetical protein AUH86_15975 [Acidobacteria bacterium 13_1_40CM_4_58_4]
MDHPVCGLCGETSHELVSESVAEAPGSSIYRCGKCGIIYQFPIMSEEEEARFYASEFERYMQGRSGPNWKSPEQHFLSYQPEGERRLALVRSFLGSQADVLEIGSSTGYFLDDLRGYVGTVTGIEPNVEYARYAKSRRIETHASIEAVNERTFDCIFLYYVLEHLRGPIEYLRKLKSLLKAGGRLIIEVPNVDDVLLSTYTIPRFGPFYWQKAHYYYFSHRTITAACQQAGYQADVVPVQRYDLSNHLVWMMEGRPGGAGRFRDIFSPELDTAYAEALKRQWLCDTVMAVVRESLE